MTKSVTKAMISKVMSDLGKRNKGISKRRPPGYYKRIANLRWENTAKKNDKIRKEN